MLYCVIDIVERARVGLCNGHPSFAKVQESVCALPKVPIACPLASAALSDRRSSRIQPDP